jgi:16S rRNA (guanine527-N7)-methyltransferase
MTINDFINELEKNNIFPTSDQLNKLEKYYELLIEYNKVMNLTGITEKDQVYLKHFYDSLTIIKAIDLKNYNSFCDMGTGAGFPGVVVKIFYPNLHVTLIDSLNKRINFLNEVIKQLNLENIEAIHARLEEYGKDNREKFDIVASRAVAKTNILLEYASPMLKINGKFVCMKGNMMNESNYQNAMQKLNMKEEKNIEFLLPFENSDRTIIVFNKIGSTNKLFPRKYNEIINKPL